MAEELQTKVNHLRSLPDVLKEVIEEVERERASVGADSMGIRDLRWKFDQVSAGMNQAIYNDQKDQVHATCLKTVAALVEILART